MRSRHVSDTATPILDLASASAPKPKRSLGTRDSLFLRNGWWWLDYHDAEGLPPYIVAALQTGARRGELLGLRWADVDMRARTVTFPKTKNGDSRTVPLDLTRFRGHPIVGAERRVRDAEESPAVPAGVSGAHH